jgi:CRP/FNR family transcriptional regulator, cyclic AMP receptor protein
MTLPEDLTHTATKRPIDCEIIRQNEVSDVLFYLESGQAKTFFDDGFINRLVDIYQPGDIIGTEALAGQPYCETVVTTSDVIIRTIPVQIAFANMKFGSELLKYLARRAADQRQLQEERVLPVAVRIIKFFLRHVARLASTDTTVTLDLPLTHDDIAASVYTSRPSTTRTIADLEKTGIMTGGRGRYTVKQFELSAYCEKLMLNFIEDSE